MTITSAQIERYQRKARDVVDAWGSLFGTSPSMRALVRVMSVGEFESHLGDARGWTGEHNWGAIKRRALSASEKATLDGHGISPEGGDAALAAARALLPAGSDEALHIDRAPGKGHHFAWFWAFPSDAAAAKKFLEVLAVQRPSVRVALERDDVTDTARAMFETHYYEGEFPNDPEANIRAYASHLARLEPVIGAALAAPASTNQPTAPPPPAPPLPVWPQDPPTWPPQFPTVPVSNAPAAPARVPARSGTAGAHLFLGAIVLVLGGILARGAHR